MNNKCKDCKWLTTPIKGKTCQDTQLKTEDCPACDEFTPSIEYIRTIDIVISNVNYKCEMELRPLVDISLHDDLDCLTNFDMNSLPRNYYTAAEWELLQSAFAECQARKDRVLEIYFSFTKVKLELDKLYRKAEAHFITTYGGFLSGFKDQASRATVTEEVLAECSNLYSDIKHLTSKCDAISANLTATGFALKELKEVAVKVFDIRSNKGFAV